MTTSDIDNRQCEINAAIEHPEKTQSRVLAEILGRAVSTAPGRRYEFDRIAGDVAAFREAVPVSRFHSVRPMIDLQKASGDTVITPDGLGGYPTGRRGDADAGCLPVGAADLRSRRMNARLTAECLATRSSLLAGQVLDLTPLGELPPPEGFADALKDLNGNAAVPGWPDLTSVRDGEVRAYLLALLALSSSSITGILAPDFRAIQAFENVLRLHGEHLLQDLEARTVRVADRFDQMLAEAVRERMLPDPERIEALCGAHRSPRGLCIATAFPTLEAIATDPSMVDPVHTSVRVPDTVQILDTGCWMPAACLGIPYDTDDRGLVPCLLDTYYEFIEPRSERILGLHEIETGVEYGILVTTASGLYRYKVEATAEVAGRAANCPLLRFRRTRECDAMAAGFTPDLAQATAAARGALQDLGLAAPFIRLSRSAILCDFVLTLGEGATGGICPSHLSAAFDRRLRKASLRYDRLRQLGHARVLQIRISGAHRARQQVDGDPMPCFAA